MSAGSSLFLRMLGLPKPLTESFPEILSTCRYWVRQSSESRFASRREVEYEISMVSITTISPGRLGVMSPQVRVRSD